MAEEQRSGPSRPNFTAGVWSTCPLGGCCNYQKCVLLCNLMAGLKTFLAPRFLATVASRCSAPSSLRTGIVMIMSVSGDFSVALSLVDVSSSPL